MKNSEDEGPFYVGYLPKAPPALARFTRKTVVIAGVIAIGSALGAAIGLPYFGAGRFEFGQPREFAGTIRCEGAAPRLVAGDADYLLVGYGKHGVPLEICGTSGREVNARGTLIQRDGKSLIELAQLPEARGPVSPAPPSVSLGRFTLRGEVVDAKCYFGVMNPAEGRTHRACAELCLRGGVPAVLVARDRSGAVVHLLIADAEGRSINEKLLRWVGEPVELSGEVQRHGRWLVLRPELDVH